ncbi:MAG: Gfo/Idh/MocA family oxidoreductase [Candidatus Jordarchaeales archaeon]
MGKDIGVGVIGLGMGSSLLALNNRKDTGLEVRGVCDVDEQKAKKYVEEFGIPFYTTDFRKLIQRKDIDVIGVYSPDYLHYEHCREALKAGKHVVCTKPLTDNFKDALDLVTLVRETGLKFMVGQTMRYEPQYAAVRRFFEDGEIGRIIFAEAHYVHDIRPVFELTPWRLEHPQDFMYGGMCHPIDVLRWFLGDVEEVHAYGCRGGLSSYPKEDNFTLNLKFASGVVGRALGLYGVVEPPEPMMKLTLYGEKISISATFTDKKGGEVHIVWDKVEYRPCAYMRFPAELGIDPYGHTQTVMRYMKHFEQCLREDLEPSPSVVDGAKTIATAYAAWQSIRESRVVRVPEVPNS